MKRELKRALLACGIAAAPLYVAVSVIQTLTRPGFDLSRHAWSLLSTGDLGWLQITNFLVSGVLVVAGAAGMRRTLHRGRARTWGPVLIGAFGVGLIAAGLFVADPMDGFPVGTPPGPPAAISWHGLLHFSVASLGFLALIAACMVFARRFAGLGERGWAAYSIATGLIFLGGFVAIASGSALPGVNIVFTVSVVLAFGWVSVVAARLRSELA
jgi:hypothetical membrane protein